MMLIHSYLTNGKPLIDFAILFLQSFKRFNGEKYRILFEGRDLRDKQISEIKSVYDNLEIINRNIDYEMVSKKLGVSVKKVHVMKEACEIKKRNVGPSGAVPWKQFISVEDRYRNSLKVGFEYCKENNINYMIHFDIDTAFYNPITPIVEIIKKHDVTLQFREGSVITRRIVGGFLGFKINDNSFKFLNKWIEYIDKIELKDKPKGYGQLSLYYTHQDMVDKIDIGKIPSFWSVSRKEFNTRNKKNLIILNGCKGNKKTNIVEFRKFLKEKK
jgi:hypothetical protein